MVDGMLSERVDVTGPLVDAFGRTARDLRVSLTDRCNLRCTYCMPAEGLEWLPTEASLTDEEVIRLIYHSLQEIEENHNFKYF